MITHDHADTIKRSPPDSYVSDLLILSRLSATSNDITRVSRITFYERMLAIPLRRVINIRCFAVRHARAESAISCYSRTVVRKYRNKYIHFCGNAPPDAIKRACEIRNASRYGRYSPAASTAEREREGSKLTTTKHRLMGANFIIEDGQ